MARRAASHILLQHKPYSFLSPSTNAKGNKQFASQLLVRKNLRNGAQWSADEPSTMLPRLQCAGRLDADSTGLMIWSTSEQIVRHIIGASTSVEKEYIVRVRGAEAWTRDRRADIAEILQSGVSLDGAPLKRADVGWLNESQLRFVLREGKHRQIRRMCEYVGLQATAVKRVRIGDIKLAGLGVGQWAPIGWVRAANLLNLDDGGGRRRQPSRGAETT